MEIKWKTSNYERRKINKTEIVYIFNKTYKMHFSVKKHHITNFIIILYLFTNFFKKIHYDFFCVTIYILCFFMHFKIIIYLKIINDNRWVNKYVYIHINMKFKFIRGLIKKIKKGDLIIFIKSAKFYIITYNIIIPINIILMDKINNIYWEPLKKYRQI